MGMFDDVRCLYPLRYPEVQGAAFQSKDTPAQILDQYEIRDDGTLWHEVYDTRVEQSDKAPCGFWVHRDNVRWEQVLFSGELEIHHCEGKPPETWYSFRFWFRDGVVKDVIPSVTQFGVNQEAGLDPAAATERTTKHG